MPGEPPASTAVTPSAPHALADALEELILTTPTVALQDEDGAVLWLKLEYCQPSGSVKDRFAARVIADALRAGELSPGSHVAEASSGSTSLALAMVCARAGLRFHAFLPDGTSPERQQALLAYNADLRLTPADAGMRGALTACAAFAAQHPGVFLTKQFTNPVNRLVHRTQTGPELRAQVPVPLDAVVAGVGTGGTLAGLGLDLLDHRPGTVVARAMPAGPLAGCQAYPPCIPGIVDGLSGLLGDLDGHLETVTVPLRQVRETTRELCRRGFPAGLSSGLNVAAARILARRLGPGRNIATILCDRSDRYLSTPLFDDLRLPGT